MRTTSCIIMALCLALTTGCYMPTKAFGPPDGENVALVNPIGNASIYPCANLRVVAATPAHVWQDPDHTRFTEIRFQRLELLKGPGEIVRGQRKGGGLYPFLVWQESEDNIIFSPGFNPLAVAGDTGIDDVYGEIRRRSKETGDRDADFRNAQPPPSSQAASVNRLTIPLVPLHAGSTPGKILVDHSMLVFLLGLDDVWASVRRAQNDPKDKEAVILICRTINQMTQAHQEKWPDYKWDTKQQHVIDWCRSIAAD